MSVADRLTVGTTGVDTPPGIGPKTIARDGALNSAILKLQAAGDAAAGAISALGESHRVSETDAIVVPALGANTVTPGVDPVQTIDRGGATGGAFDLKFGGSYATGLAFNASAATVQAALRLLPGLSAVTVAAGVGDDLAVTFVGRGAPESLLGVDDRTTGGTGVTVATTTPGVTGSVSIAYTEGAEGDSVFLAVVRDSTGESFDPQLDAASPAVVDGLEPGDYTVIARTVEDKRVSTPVTSTFTMTSA